MRRRVTEKDGERGKRKGGRETPRVFGETAELHRSSEESYRVVRNSRSVADFTMMEVSEVSRAMSDEDSRYDFAVLCSTFSFFRSLEMSIPDRRGCSAPFTRISHTHTHARIRARTHTHTRHTCIGMSATCLLNAFGI